MAAADARQKLMELAAQNLDVQPQMLSCAGGRIYVTEQPERGYTLGQLTRMGLTSRTGPIMGTAALSAMPFAPVFNTQAVEVKVDKDTGTVRLVRFVQAQDVGAAINPMAVGRPIQGGGLQGNWPALSAEVGLRER